MGVVCNENSKIALQQALEKIGVIKNFVKSDDIVVVKANICGGNPLIKGSLTSIEVIFAYSDWIIKYINLPIFKKLIFDLLPVIGLFILDGLLFILECYILFFMSNQITLKLVESILKLFSAGMPSLYFSWNHTFRQNIVLMTIGALFGSIMELMCMVCGPWSYHIDFLFMSPIFLIFLWSMRTLAIGGLMSLLKTEILE